MNGPSRLAAALGCTKQTVSNWRTTQVPDSWAVHIERLTGVPVEELRPDLPWVRTRDKAWPNGMPLLDVSARVPSL